MCVCVRACVYLCVHLCVYVRVCLWMLLLLPCHGLSPFMWFPIVRVWDWRASCHPGWPSQIRMTFMFTSCLQNVAWCCLICGMCLLLMRPFVGGRAEPGEGSCPAQSGRAWGCFSKAGPVTSKDEGHRPCLVSVFQKSSLDCQHSLSTFLWGFLRNVFS